MTRGRAKAPAKAETPVELLARRKTALEGSIADVDRQLRAGERKRDRLTVQREAYLEELRGVDEAIERLGGVPATAEDVRRAKAGR